MIQRPLLFLPCLCLLLAACTEQRLPEFSDPVPIIVPSGSPAYGPRLSENGSDSVILSWMERADSIGELRFAAFAIDEWQSAGVAAIDAQMFVNWADLPMVVGSGENGLLAQWLSYVADGKYAYQVLLSRSDDRGDTWSEPFSPHDDNTPTEHGFVSVLNDNASPTIVWLDGRETPAAPMTLRAATINGDNTVTEKSLLDDAVCDCCQTDAAMTSSGAIVVYRDRTEDEVRDIYITRHVDGQWQPGTPVSDDGWVVSGCPVNGPALSAEDKRVVVTWFSAANDRPVVKAVVSSNGGKSFSLPLEIAAGESVQGHVGSAVIDRHSAVVSWIESEGNGSYAIKLRAITFDGQTGHVETVGRTSVARNVPQLARVNDELILAWTDRIGGKSKLASVRVRIRGFYD